MIPRGVHSYSVVMFEGLRGDTSAVMFNGSRGGHSAVMFGEFKCCDVRVV